MEPQHSEGPRDWQNLFAIRKFGYIKVLFRIFYYNWGKENHSSYRGLRYIEVHYIEFPLYLIQWSLLWVSGNCPIGSYCLLVTPKQIIAVAFVYPIANDQWPIAEAAFIEKGIYCSWFPVPRALFFLWGFHCLRALFSEIAFTHRSFCRGSVLLESSAYSWAKL